MPVLEDIAKGEQFTDVPLQPGDVKPALSQEDLSAEHAKMREAFRAKGLPLPPLAPGEKETVKPADPFAAEQQVPHDKFAGEQQVQDPFKGQRQADALDERTPQDLAKDPNFKIHDFIFANKDNIFSDPQRYQKALDTYRESQAQGITAAKTIESVKKETIPLLKDIVKSIPKRLENISDIAIAPLVNDITMKFRHEALDPEKRAQWEDMTEADKEKAVAEAVAGTQTAVGSLQDMVRQGTRKLLGPALEFGGKKDWRKISDDELKNELFKDLGWRETVEGLSRGEGVQDLVDKGVQLDPENIKLLSLTDPITLVATGAGLKAVGAAGKVLFTAADEAGANAALGYLGRQAGTAAAKGAQLAGRGAEVTGQVIGKAAHLPTFTAAGLGSGHFFKALAAAGAGKVAGKIIEKGGTLLREVGEAAGAAPEGQLSLGLESTTGAKVLNAAKTAAAVITPPVAGAVKGAAATAPLAFATDEPQGGLLGVGAVGGAVHGTVSGVKGAVAEAGAKRYFDPGQITWEKTPSPGYDNFSAMNAVHDQVAAQAPENARNMVNSLRETLRPFGKKLFLVDDATYQKAIENDAVRANGNQPLSPEQQAAVAEESKSRGVSKIFMADDAGKGEMVTLVKATEDAPHEVSHVLESVLAPEARKALHDSVRENYSGDELQQLKDHYESQLGRKMTPDEVESEFIADNWANLLYNTSLESLGLPSPRRGFKQTMLDASLALGNALGFDMTAGRKTPGLDIRPSYSLRKRLVEASGDILNESNRLAAQQATAPEAPAPEVKPAAPEGAPAAPVTPEEVKPAEVPAQGELNFEPSAKPEAAPAAPPPAPAPAEGPPTVRPDKSAKRAEVTNTGVAMKWAEDKPNRDVVDTVNQALDEKVGLKVEHSGAPAEVFTPTEPEREAEIEAGRGLPPDLREQHSKELRPTRWETMKSGEPQLIARSTDKVLANVDRAVQWAKKAGETVPWETDDTGALTPAGANQLLTDLNTYWDNQDRGFRGGGEKLVRPPAKLGASIPAEQGEGVVLGADKEQWLNLLQGRETGPPVTARAGKGLPANIKAQEIRAAQGLESERIAGGENIPVYPAKVTGGRGAVEVKETNPLRNRLRAAGMPVGDLHSVVERLNATDLLKAERRPELTGRGGSTDITRAGFLTEKPVSETIDEVVKDSPEQWQARFGPNATLTGSAYDLGLGLKNPADLKSLMDAHDAATKTAQASMAEVRAGNFDALDRASADATKAQFFREAIEAATDSGSAAGPAGWRRSRPNSQPPFATPESRRGFLPEEKPAEGEPDAIKQASIRTKGGQVFTGSWHGEALDNFYEAARKGEVKDLPAGTNLTDPDPSGLYSSGYLTDGFNTKSGKFLDRAQALEHSVKIGQFKPAEKGNIARTGELEANEFTGRRAFLTPEPLKKIQEGEDGTGETFNRRGKVMDLAGKPMLVVTLSSRDVTRSLLSNKDLIDSFKDVPGHVPNVALGVFNIARRGPKGEPLTSVDLNVLVPKEHLENAIKFARDNNQESIWDAEKGELISTGGTGESKLLAKDFPDAAQKLVKGEPVTIGPQEHAAPTIPSDAEITDALSVDKRPFVGEHRDLDPGTPVGVRIDIPAYNRTGKFVQTIHEKASGGQVGKRIGYDSIVTLDDPTFFSNEKGARKIKEGAAKFPIATVEGKFNPEREVPADLEDWTAVGFNPTKHSYFYDKVTDEPVTGGSKAVSVGNTVYVKDATFGTQAEVQARGGYLTPENTNVTQKKKPGTPEYNDYVTNKIEKSKQFPEAHPLQFVTDDKGDYMAQWDGEPLPINRPYDLFHSDLAEKAGSKEEYRKALADKLDAAYAEAKKNPDVHAGETWYSEYRAKAKNLLGDDMQLFAELLGATSPQQLVGPNFKDALAAYNEFRKGAYDDMLKKYQEGKQKFAAGDISDYMEAKAREKQERLVAKRDAGKLTAEEFAAQEAKNKKKGIDEPTKQAYLNWWQETNNLIPTKSTGKKFGMNSRAVLRVLDRSWLQGVEGPKTPNFTGNLSGASFKATIDVWAMRLLHRLSNEDSGQPWRIQSANETGISDPEFFFGQDVMQDVADKHGIQADALQAILWFAEKDHYEKQGWIKSAGKEKSDYNSLIAKTTKTPEGFLSLKELEKKPKGGKVKKAVLPETP
jgi:hypothetical protein